MGNNLIAMLYHISESGSNYNLSVRRCFFLSQKWLQMSLHWSFGILKVGKALKIKTDDMSVKFYHGNFSSYIRLILVIVLPLNFNRFGNIAEITIDFGALTFYFPISAIIVGVSYTWINFRARCLVDHMKK